MSNCQLHARMEVAATCVFKHASAAWAAAAVLSERMCAGDTVRVLDVGCGANLIYPLLGAALHGWRFVGSDVTDAALECAARNAAANPHLAPLIDLRRVEAGSPLGARDLLALMR